MGMRQLNLDENCGRLWEGPCPQLEGVGIYIRVQLGSRVLNSESWLGKPSPSPQKAD